MDEDTTTATPTPDTGADATAQPVETDIFGDAAAPEPQPTTTNEPVTTPEAATPAVDENVEWLQNKGIDPTDPEAIAKVAKMYRDAERAMHEAKQPKLNEALTQPAEGEAQTPEQIERENTLESRLEAIELERNVTNFFAADGNAELAAERKALEPAMTEIVQSNPAIGQMVKVGYMSYDDLAALAKGKDPSYGAKLKQDGGREALENVAGKQQARAVPGVATTSAVSGDTGADPFLAAFDSVK